MCACLINFGEDLTGSRFFKGGLSMYEYFTGTKEVIFKGRHSNANHTFATLALQFFKEPPQNCKDALSAILTTLSRNPWACELMPKYEDNRSDSWNWYLSYSGWEGEDAGANLGDDDPVSKMLYGAQHALKQLKPYLLDDKLPPYGFVPAVQLPADAGNSLNKWVEAAEKVQEKGPEPSERPPLVSGKKVGSVEAIEPKLAPEDLVPKTTTEVTPMMLPTAPLSSHSPNPSFRHPPIPSA